MEHLMWILVVAATFGSTSCIKCPTSETASFRMTVGSRRNISGHWLLSIDAYREDSRSLQLVGDRKGLVLGMDHGASFCQGTETQHLAVNVAVPGMAPPEGYRPMAELGFYKTYLTPLTWVQARDKCEEDGAHLLILDSEQETNVIKEFFAMKHKITGAAQTVYIHVGVHDRYKEGHYEDVLGVPVPTAGNALWYPGQPDGGAENCVVGTTIGRYGDAPCEWKLAFICEYM